MSSIIKVAVTDLVIGDDHSPAIANQPHLDLETNIDNLISYLSGSSIGAFDYDTATSTGLNFGYTAGVLNVNGTVTDVAASTILMTATDTNYVELNTTTNAIVTNLTGWTLGFVPLWEVVTDGSTITGVTDRRSQFFLRSQFQDNVNLSVGTGGDLTIRHDATDSYVENITGSLFIDQNVNSGLIDVSTFNSVGTTKLNARFGGATPEVLLYYDATERLKTTTAGGTLTGTWNATVDLEVAGESVATEGEAIAFAIALGG